MTQWGGYFGIATAAAAWYASFAGVVNETFKKAIIPTIPLGPPPAPVVVSGGRRRVAGPEWGRGEPLTPRTPSL